MCLKEMYRLLDQAFHIIHVFIFFFLICLIYQLLRGLLKSATIMVVFSFCFKYFQAGELIHFSHNVVTFISSNIFA